MNKIHVSWYNHQEQSYGVTCVDAYSLTEAIEIVRKLHKYTIFVYSVEYADFTSVITKL